MRLRALAGIVALVVLTGACTSDDDEPDLGAPSPSESLRRLGTFDVTGDCDDLRRLRRPQMSFVAAGNLFVANQGKSVARCVLEVGEANDLEWGPTGDRAHFGDLRRYDGDRVVSIDDQSESVAWSRPTGTSVVYISDGRLRKVEAFGEKPFDFSFLADHDEVAYHPAGTHIAVTGTDKDGTYGLWLATNLGKEPQLLAIGEDARRIFSLSWEHDGTTIYYTAEHDDRFDTHSLRLALKDKEGKIRDAELATLDSHDGEMGDVVANEFVTAQIAYTVGSCDEGKSTRVSTGGEITELGGPLGSLSTEPVGWLPNGKLLVLARASGCEGDGTLYSWRPEKTTRLVANVSAAGVRAQLPEEPGPPGSKQEVVA